MTTISPAQLVAPAYLEDVDTSVYSPPTQTSAQIGRAVFTNTSASATTFTAGITTGGALGGSNTMISARVIAPGEAYVSPELAGAVIPFGSQLHAYSAAGSAVVFEVSGIIIQ